jgi:hypothetical protein
MSFANFLRRMIRKEPIPPEISPETSERDSMKLICVQCGTEYSPILQCSTCPHDTVDPVKLNGGQDQLGNIYPIELNNLSQVYYPPYTAGGLVNSVVSSGSGNITGGGGGGGWVSGNQPVVSGGTFGPAPVLEPAGIGINKQCLTIDEIYQIIQTCTLTLKADETLVICLDADTPQPSVDAVTNILEGLNIQAVVLPRPAEAASARTAPPTTENERLDILTQLGLLWRAHPEMRFGELITTMTGSSLPDIGDYALIEALQQAYGVAQ